MRSDRIYPLLCLLSLLFLSPPPARGGGTAAVLSAGSGPYLEAYSAFRREYGREVKVYDLSGSAELPKEEDVVVTFGGKAALAGGYPGPALVVSCMSPGSVNDGGGRAGRLVIPMVPEPRAALLALTALQPGLKRLGVFAAAGTYGAYLDSLAEAGRALGLEIVRARVRGAEDLPAELRRLHGGMDAFWLLPDPLLVNVDSFTVFRDFSRANRVPFYAPTEGLARKGATAAVYVSFAEMGRAAARAARGGAAGFPGYAVRTSYAVNLPEAAYIGMDVPRSALAGAAAVVK